jgi:Alginate lyase
MTELNRRRFVTTAGVAGSFALLSCSWGQKRDAAASATFQMVASTDKKRILEAAEKYVSNSPLTITASPTKRSAGGLHDFYSQADYYWADSNNPEGPYVLRDGQSNPDNFNDHRKVMVDLSVEMPALTAAWILTGDKRYGKKACDHLRAWFVVPDTRMNPNLEHSQAIQNLNTGRSIGVIDTLHLVEVARAASHLMPKMMDVAGRESVKEWFRSYLDWLKTSEKGKAERDTLNNHAMCWALQAAEFAHLLDDTVTREEVFRQYLSILLPNQLGPDGSFPRELARTKPYSYSIFNFDVMTALCQSLKGLQPDPLAFRLADGRGVCKAAEFIYPYLKDKGKWKWVKDVQHFDSLPVRSPGLLFAGVACNRAEYIALWRTMNPDPTDREIIRNNPIRQPLLWV